jgi:hypothetical protein
VKTMPKSSTDVLRAIALARKRLAKEQLSKKKKKEPEKKSAPEAITEFDNVEDWMMTMILVAIMHANPGVDEKEAIEIGRAFVKKLHMPNSAHLWRRQINRVQRTGVRAAASRIRRELYKLI